MLPSITPARLALAALGAFLLPCSAVQAQGSVKSFVKISDTSPERNPVLMNLDQLGRAVTAIGDFNGDGIPDIAGGAHGSDDGGANGTESQVGSVWLFGMNRDGTVKSRHKISATSGGFTGVLEDFDGFGRAVSGIGDLNGDGVPDIAVGATGDDDGGEDWGAVYILFLNANGTVKSHQKISELEGNFSGNLGRWDEFGRGITNLGDMDGDGVQDLAVAATNDDDGGINRGAVYILFMNANGTVKSHQKISDTQGGFPMPLVNYDSFGMSVDTAGDMDQDGVMDLVVGSIGDDAAGNQSGAIYTVYLNADGTVKSAAKVNHFQGGIRGLLDSVDQFGFSVTGLGDVDSDGVPDYGVGAILDDDGGDFKDSNRGALWVLMMNRDGTVKTYRKISATQGGLPDQLDKADWFGSACANLGDLNLDGIPDVAVGARFDDDGGSERGAIYVIFLDDTPPTPPVSDFYAFDFDRDAGEVVRGPAPFTVNFEDKSTGDIGRWVWRFGDGTTPYTFQHSSHTYLNPGTYAVTLDLEGPAGNDSLRQEGFVIVDPPNADFTSNATIIKAPATIFFQNESSEYLTDFLWDFGTGGTSIQTNGFHRYNQPGRYTVSLSGTGGGYSDTVVKTDYLWITEYAKPMPEFTADVTTGDAPLSVQFTDASGGELLSYLWDFGDGTTSTAVNPRHVYQQPGSYTVTLSLTNPEMTVDFTLEETIVADVPPAPVAGLAASPTSGLKPLTVTFTDTSSGHHDSWTWDFGDGNTSTERNPSHAYDTAGVYTVSLTIGGLGGSDQQTRTDLVTVIEPPPVADFSLTGTSGWSPLTTTFTDLSTGQINAWLWDFGDGTTSNEVNPTHVYANAGIYDVTLTVEGNGGVDAMTLPAAVEAIEPVPVASFTTTNPAALVPFDVTFTDTSSGLISAWLWDFGDGTTSTETNPTHTYTTSGAYSVTLTVSGAGGVDSTTSLDLIDAIEPPPVASFTHDSFGGHAPHDVTFTDTSTGHVTAWLWSFGDGATSTEASPTHTYETPGTYDVSLTVTGDGGSDVLTQPALILITEAPPVADFTSSDPVGFRPHDVTFTDTSTGQVNVRAWDFGDGTTGSGAAPTHTYATVGTYDVTLTVTGDGGADTVLQTGLVVITEAPPVAAFTNTEPTGFRPHDVTFTDTSTGHVDTRLWDFGDGTTSTDAAPTHSYETVGTYDVTLTVEGDGGVDALTSTGLVVISEAPPVAAFTSSEAVGFRPHDVTFTDTSTGHVHTRLWDFGDGMGSADASPTHTYEAVGTYDVTLTVEGDGGVDAVTQAALVVISEAPPVALFSTTTATSGPLPLDVGFSDDSTGHVTSYLWDFGDGATSTEASPTHTYTTEGTYDVTLTVTGDGGTDVQVQTNLVIVLEAPPRAGFSATNTLGLMPLQVQFTDQSTGSIVSRLWDFGDGTTSTKPSPSHTYVEAGVFSVSLTVTGPGGGHTLTRTDLVTAIEPPPVADFVVGNSSGEAPLAVFFADNSFGAIDTWLWDFGDGTTGSAQNEAHVYEIPGVYTVSLTVEGPGGVDTRRRQSAVNVLVPPPAGISDGSFERQVSGAEPRQPWDLVGTGSHVVNPAQATFSSELTGGQGGHGEADEFPVHPEATTRDGVMPVAGRRWLELSNAGSSNATPPDNPFGESAPSSGAVGVRQSFRYGISQSILELQGAFLPGEMSGPGDLDWLSVEVSDGTTTVSLYYVDSTADAPLESEKYRSPMTDPFLVSADLRTLFPLSDTKTEFTLSLLMGNSGADARPSRAYVDGVVLTDQAGIRSISCGANPERSLVVLSGTPRVGERVVFGIDNPVGSQGPGSIPLLVFSTDRHPTAPCGASISWGMIPGTPGAVQISVLPPNPSAILTGGPWEEPGRHVPISLHLPLDPSLAGMRVYAQGLMVDPRATQGGVRFGLTEALSFRILP